MMGTQVLGRDAELAALAGFIGSVRDGPAAALIEGEAGVGKTTLWQAGVRSALDEGFQVLSCRPAEPESKLSYSALGDLLEGSFDAVVLSLGDPQRRALEVALLRVDAMGHVPDPRAVGVAFLAAIRLLATARPVLLAVEDVQWLDAPGARVVGYGIRRLEREPIGVLATLRTQPGLVDGLGLERAFAHADLHRIRVPPLDLVSLARLLREQLDAEFSRPTIRRLHEASSGNPFFALEIGRVLAQRTEPLEPGEPLPVPQGSRELLDARLAALSPPTRHALLVVSTLARPTIAAVTAAIGAAASEALAPAERAGIVETHRERIRFTHPLLGSAVYTAATSDELRDVHRVLGGWSPIRKSGPATWRSRRPARIRASRPRSTMPPGTPQLAARPMLPPDSRSSLASSVHPRTRRPCGRERSTPPGTGSCPVTCREPTPSSRRRSRPARLDPVGPISSGISRCSRTTTSGGAGSCWRRLSPSPATMLRTSSSSTWTSRG